MGFSQVKGCFVFSFKFLLHNGNKLHFLSTGARGFSLSSYGSGVSTVEPFLVDEKKITAKLVIFWIEKRLAAQGIIPVWQEWVASRKVLLLLMCRTPCKNLFILHHLLFEEFTLQIHGKVNKSQMLITTQINHRISIYPWQVCRSSFLNTCKKKRKKLIFIQLHFGNHIFS